MDDSPGSLPRGTMAAEWLQSRWRAFRSLPAQTQLVSALASAVLIVSAVLAMALWPSSGGSKAADAQVAGSSDQAVILTPGLSPTAGTDSGSGGAGGSGAGASGGGSGGSGNSGQQAATPTAGSSQSTPPPVAITCLAVSATAAQLCAHTAADAALTATVTYTATSTNDASTGLMGARAADPSGNYTWSWLPVTAIPGSGGQACVGAQLADTTSRACLPFTVSAQPLPSVVPTLPVPTPTAIPTAIPSVIPTAIPTILPTVTLPVSIPTIPVALPTATLTVPLPALSASEGHGVPASEDTGSGAGSGS